MKQFLQSLASLKHPQNLLKVSFVRTCNAWNGTAVVDLILQMLQVVD